MMYFIVLGLGLSDVYFIVLKWTVQCFLFALTSGLLELSVGIE